MRPPCDPSKRPLPDGLLGQRVEVALHFTNRCYTVAIRGKVRGYTPAVWLRDVTPRVQPGGYEACRREQQRNVHAWLLGELVDAGEAVAAISAPADWRPVSYRCKDGPPCFFFADDGVCLGSAPQALALPGGVWVAPAAYEVVVQTKRGPYRWAPYASRDAALGALPDLELLALPGLIKGTWEVLPLHGGAGP
jgi:hypothetical protein